jgi:hypothetical protein
MVEFMLCDVNHMGICGKVASHILRHIRTVVFVLPRVFTNPTKRSVTMAEARGMSNNNSCLISVHVCMGF